MVLRPGFEPGSPARKNLFAEKASPKMDFSLNWIHIRDKFEDWLQSMGYSEGFKVDVLSYLTRYVSEIRSPLDIISLFSKIERGKRHLVMALRILFNFYETVGYRKADLDVLRKALPKVKYGIDLKIPSETEILDSLKKLSKAPVKYQALYNLLIDSGLRLVEAVELIKTFTNADLVTGFYRSELDMFRGQKQAYYGHFTEYTLDLIRQANEKPECVAASRYFRKFAYVAPKYLRKYAFDKMIDLDIPESVADFIQGRVPKKIGAKHYMALARQASKFYPRYTKYIQKLRKRLTQTPSFSI